MFNKIKTIISGSSSSPEIIYKDFTIMDRNNNAKHPQHGIIRKTIFGACAVIEVDNASRLDSKHDASDCAARKAKIIIDEMGDKIFEVDWL